VINIIFLIRKKGYKLKSFEFLFSFKTTLICLAILAAGAGYATFIENDFGTSSARVLVYNNLWYEAMLILTTINMTAIIYKYKMWRNKGRFIFHTSFVVILIGAGVTRYAGYEGIMKIKEGTTINSMLSLEPYLQVTIDDGKNTYYQEYQKEFTSLLKRVNYFNHDIAFDNKTLNIEYKDYLFAKKDNNAKMGLVTVVLTLDGKQQEIRIPGLRGQIGMPRELVFGDVKVNLEYGSKVLSIPFSIKLNDFQLDRYPGSMAPSSYASEVTVFKEDKTSYDYRIFMNKTMHEGNFLFFQSSYFPDESGTVLSVNNDPGKWPTYLGYFLLTLGLVMNLFDKKSRFWKLSKYVSSKNAAAAITALFLVFSTSSLEANEQENSHKVKAQNTVEYLKKLKNESAKTADNFSKLVVQSHGGRMKPASTLNHEIILKLTGKKEFLGMNPNQVVLGLVTRPEVWRDVKMVKIKTPKLKKFLGIEESRKYIAFTEVFKDGQYILGEESNKAALVKPQDRGTYEKDIVRLDERLSIMYSVFNGNLFSLFPEVKENAEANSKWYAPLEAIQSFQGQNKTVIETMIRGLMNSVIENQWEDADKYISMIKLYQEKVGSDVNLSKEEIENEILFNKLDIFLKLTLAYIFLGLIMLIVAFTVVFNPKIKPKKITTFFFIILAALFATHTFGMGFRWVLSGHAPWSDLYESLLYISWSAIFAGVIFFRKSLLALSASVIIAGIFMFTAHLTGIDPQITNLVPVLKSYWLTIHVSILTASYGFFGLGAILGFMSLIMFIFRKNRPHLDDTIKHISSINEIALIIGLTFITIGNFLGGVWANESWGRYWGWDPKETWAYVSIVVYVFVLHMRFVKPLNNPFAFSTASLLAFGSILMTYFGVNFYLSGMHSYATGDPVPIPMWVYYVVTGVFVTIALAYRNRNMKDVLTDNETPKA
jgi:cytochrome c-type biogenesis protein CcsB